MSPEYTFSPIAVFRGSKTQTLEASSQGILDPQSIGRIDLKNVPNWRQTLSGLETFSHLWILFIFHQHHGRWNPQVLPPRATHKVGVFASRSPYRPNSLGMSVVKIEAIKNSTIIVSGHDLLDQTPILDLKPYLPYADSIPDANQGWLKECQEYQVVFGPQGQEQMDFLKQHGLTELEATVTQQLRFHPTDKKRKRIKKLNEPNLFLFCYRTWRIKFRIHDQVVSVEEIFSGYSEIDLHDPQDPYRDKKLHLLFHARGQS